MATVNKDFVVKNGLQVGGLTTLAAPAVAGSIYFPSGSDPSSLTAGHLWRNGDDLKIYLGATPGTKTIAYTDSTITGTWNGSVIAPDYGGTGVSNAASSTITLGGALEFSGAYTATFTLTDDTTVTFPTTGTLATTSNKLSDFASTTSAELAGTISDETGFSGPSDGVLVFNYEPTFQVSIDGDATFEAFVSSTDLTIANTTSAQNLNIATASTGSSNYYLATGATANGETKNVEIGTNGVNGSTTNISIGSTTGTSTTTVNQDLVVGGDLTVHGTTTTIESTTLAVTDINIEMGVPVAPAVATDTTADGGGIILKGDQDHSILWYNESPRQYWEFNSGINLTGGLTYSINSVERLSDTKVTLTDTVIESTDGAASVTSTSPTVFGSFDDGLRAAKFMITLEQDGDYMVTEVLIIQNGTNVYITEYGRIQVGSTIDATIDADMGVGAVDLSVTSSSASVGSPLLIKYTYTAITA
jgi:hypothetical protein